jgi:hypothetical protein
VRLEDSTTPYNLPRSNKAMALPATLSPSTPDVPGKGLSK